MICGMLLYDSMIWIQTLIVHSGNLVDHTGISPGDGWCTLFVVCRGTGIPEIPQPHSVQSLHCHRCTTSKRKHKKSQVRKGHKPWQSSSKLALQSFSKHLYPTLFPVLAWIILNTCVDVSRNHTKIRNHMSNDMCLMLHSKTSNHNIVLCFIPKDIQIGERNTCDACWEQEMLDAVGRSRWVIWLKAAWAAKPLWCGCRHLESHSLSQFLRKDVMDSLESMKAVWIWLALIGYVL